MKFVSKKIIGLLLGVSTFAFAAVPMPTDFRYAVDLAVDARQPVQELTLPDAVYADASRADLADLQVFNGAQRPVPFALCPALMPQAAPEVETRLAIFPIMTGRRVLAQASGDRLVVIVNPDTAQPQKEPSPTPPGNDAYVLDLRPVSAALAAIRVDWHADAYSEVQLRVEASDDLNRWTVVVPQTTLLHATAPADAGQSIARDRIALPEQRYRYLRIARSDGGLMPVIDGVIAVSQPAQTSGGEPVWVDATALPASKVDVVGSLDFDAAHQAGFEQVRIQPQGSNVILKVALLSRARPELPWRSRWSGEVFDLMENATERRSAPVELDGPVHDRYWRVQSLASTTQALPSLALRLGYHPPQLRFVSEGEGPFTLAFGSARVTAATARGCGELLSTVSRADLQSMIGTATAGAPRIVGSADTLLPLTGNGPAERRKFLLWGVLALGSGILVWMALSLLKGSKPGD